MEKHPLRPVAPLVIMCCIALFFVTRTVGFENIRAVQFLLIFVSGALAGLALGIVRSARVARSSS
ncbi:MAG: hypothetical protein WB699_12225 [Bacteroidota bacterium]